MRYIWYEIFSKVVKKVKEWLTNTSAARFYRMGMGEKNRNVEEKEREGEKESVK
jgi:hypothetical protein